MKSILLALVLCSSSTTFAQFVVTGGTMTLEPFSLLTVDSLIIQPGATGLSITNNAISHTNTPQAANSGNTINEIYQFSSPISMTGFLTLKYDDAQLNGNSASSLQMIYSATNAPLTWVTTTGTLVNTTSKQIQQSFNNTVISSVSATSNTTPLALELLSFDAEKSSDQQSANLSWTVSSTENLKSFEIEKSADARSFEKLGSVGVSSILNYELNDKNPLNGRNYYRLKMIDKQETVSFSEVRMLTFGKVTSDVSLYPNPAQTTFTIHTTDASLLNTEAMVYDLNGKTIAQFTLSTENTIVSAENWIAGMYIIRLQNGQVFKLEKR